MTTVACELRGTICTNYDGHATIRAGDDATLHVFVTDQDGDALDMSDGTARYGVFGWSRPAPDEDASFTGSTDGGSVVDEGIGRLVIHISHSVTAAMVFGRHYHELRWRSGAGVCSTLLVGRLMVER